MLCEKDDTACKVPLEQEVVLNVSVLAAFLLLYTLSGQPPGYLPKEPLLASQVLSDSLGSRFELEERQGKG